MNRALLASWVLVACHASSPVDAGVQLSSDAASSVAPVTIERDELPPRGAYAGSSACRDCHVERFEAWSHDWHARALSEANASTVVGRFTGQHFKGESAEATMLRIKGAYVMRTAGRDGGMGDYSVSAVVGGKHMQDAITELPDGRWQVLPVYFHATGAGAWVDYNGTKQGKVDAEHPFFWANFRRTANHECIACHATGWSVHYNRADQTWSTRAEFGVGCEACHGPGARHAESKAAEDIVAFSKLSKEQALSICASCHGPREPHASFFDEAVRFRPGARYADHFYPSGLVDGDRRSGEYFADGRPSSSSFEYQALLQSKCFRSAEVTCGTCHRGPHNEKPMANELKADADAACVECHVAEAGNRVAHTHHLKPDAQRCVACHMPPTVSGVLDHFADHSIDVPVPETTLSHGVPNACGVCHAKKTPAQVVKDVETWWPNSTRRARRIRLANAFDEATQASSAEALVEVVRDANEAPLLRGFAAELLGQRFASRAAEVLPPLLRERDAGLRSRVVAGLGAAKARGSVNDLVERLSDSSVLVRQYAAILLSNWGDHRGLAALEKLATASDTESLVRPHLVLAQKYAASHRLAEARREVNAALRWMPHSVPMLVLEADLLMQEHDAAAAQRTLEEALKFDPSSDSVKRRLNALSQKMQ